MAAKAARGRRSGQSEICCLPERSAVGGSFTASRRALRAYYNLSEALEQFPINHCMRESAERGLFRMITIPAKELDRYVGDDRVLIADVRSCMEYNAGHIRGAVNVPDGDFDRFLQKGNFEAVLLYCNRGSRSMAAARMLENRGWNTITVIGGLKAYRGSNLVTDGGGSAL